MGIRAFKRARTAAGIALTYRAAVLSIVDSTPGPMTGHAIAQAAGLTHKQCVDALTALYNNGRIARLGRKSTARWLRLCECARPAGDAINLLEDALRTWKRF